MVSDVPSARGQRDLNVVSRIAEDLVDLRRADWKIRISSLGLLELHSAFAMKARRRTGSRIRRNAPRTIVARHRCRQRGEDAVNEGLKVINPEVA